MIHKTMQTIKNTGFGIYLSLKSAPVHAILIGFLFLLQGIIPILEALVLRKLIDGVIMLNISNATKSGVCFILLIVIQAFIGSGIDLVYSVFTKNVSHYIDSLLIDKIVVSDYSFFDNADQQSVLNLVQSNQGVIQTIAWQSLQALTSVIALFSTVTMLISLAPILPIIVFAVVIPSAIINKKYQAFLWNYDYQQSKTHRKMEYYYNALVDINNVEEIRIHNAANFFESTYKKLWQMWQKDKINESIKHNRQLFATNICQVLCLAGICVYAIMQCIADRITVGGVQFYINMSEQIKANIETIFNTSLNIYMSSEKIELFRNFIKWEPATLDAGSLVPNVMPHVEFRNVSFKYPNSDIWVLRNCSFTIAPGKRLALVGKNGSGKSTIVKLLCRFYDATEGDIYIDGKSIRSYDIKEYRNVIGVLFQTSNIYAMSLRDNITIGRSFFYNEDALYNAIEFSGVDSLIHRHPGGVGAPLTRRFDETGIELSGGQKQKVALARTFYKDSTFLILDEPSASLDPEAEYMLFEKFLELWQAKSAILISHRLANAALCDDILVLDNGKIAEQGSHAELLDASGLYAKLFLLQAQKYMASEEVAEKSESEEQII